MRRVIIALALPLWINCACGVSHGLLGSAIVNEKSVESLLPIPPNREYVLEKDFDLKGQTFVIPEGVQIASEGGVFKNGTLIGNNTQIKTNKAVFKNVHIEGTWNVPIISTSLFKDLTYTNSLKDVIALSSPSIQNVVTVETGDYSLSTTSFGSALELFSNTELIIYGHLYLLQNDYKGCYVVSIKDSENIIVRGSGIIEGDRVSHTGNNGEWGHGINIINSRNILVSGLTVTNCWGDCIYIGKNSSNITVDSCKLSKGRRQGVSITSGSHIYIMNCVISDVKGTRPEYAIDVEPNKGETLDDVVIDNVQSINCVGGFKSWGGAKDASIGTVTLRNCSVKGASTNTPIRFVYGENLVIEDCTFETGDKPGIYTDVINKVTLKNNTIRSSNRNAIHVSRARTKSILNNKVSNR